MHRTYVRAGVEEPPSSGGWRPCGTLYGSVYGTHDGTWDSRISIPFLVAFIDVMCEYMLLWLIAECEQAGLRWQRRREQWRHEFALLART